ncbi:DoxX family protein [Runella zeae]|uniref:DoxX family protein n=1 Tax=Runella zeae TaxID=94255 RepID=UPI00040B6DCD|nr:DoxX family protein [Runella zeae]
MKANKILNIGLWVAQGLLALTFIWAAYTKLFQPLEEAAKMLPWAKENPGLVKLTGVFELLGALGLILPAALRIQPKLTVFAAYGAMVLMVSAAIFHISRGEASLIGMNIFFFVLAAFIAWGRTTKAPILSKN